MKIFLTAIFTFFSNYDKFTAVTLYTEWYVILYGIYNSKLNMVCEIFYNCHLLTVL